MCATLSVNACSTVMKTFFSLIKAHRSWLLSNRLIGQHYRHEEIQMQTGTVTNFHVLFTHAQQMQIQRRGSCQGDAGQGDSTHAHETHSISDTNAASALLAVRSTQSCGLGKAPLLQLRGLLQVQGGMSDPAALSVVVGLTWPFPTNKD